MARTHIAFILDSSVSMVVIKEPVIVSYNEQITALRETHGLRVAGVSGTGTWRQKNPAADMQVTGTLTLFGHKRPGLEPVAAPRVPYQFGVSPWGYTAASVQFDSTYNVEVKFLGQSLYSIAPLTAQTYQPFGNTPLYDAMGLTLERMQTELPYSEGDAYLVMVFSDGEENYSKYWMQDRLRNLVMELQNSGKWTFTFQGASKMGIEQFLSLGVPRANTYAFVPSVLGVQAAGVANAIGTQTYMGARIVGTTAVHNFYETPNTAGDGNPSIVTAVTAEPSKSRIGPSRKRKFPWKG